jgi:hypothetical protein
MKKIKLHKVEDSAGNLVECVRVDEITPAPENLLIYPTKSDEFIDLEDLMKTEYVENNIANHTEAEIDLYSGMVLSGCQRTLVAKKNGWEYLRAKASPKKYNEMSTWGRIEYLQKVNIDGKRNEQSAEVITTVYRGLEHAFLEEHPDRISYKHSDSHKNFCKARGIDRKDLSRILVVAEKKPELLKEIDTGKYSIHKAWREAQNVQKTVVKQDLERFDFIKHAGESSTFKKNLKNGVLEAVDHFRKTPICGKQLVDDEQFGFEYPMISAHFSNIINSAAAFSYVEVDMKVKTGRKAVSSNGDSRPDIYFPSISKVGFQEEKVEVKVASYAPQPSAIIYYGGPGAINCHPHEYLLGITSDGGAQIFLMLATLTPKDWKSAGSGKVMMSLGTWFDNHFEKNDYKFLMGDISRTGNQKKFPHVNFYRDEK